MAEHVLLDTLSKRGRPKLYVDGYPFAFSELQKDGLVKAWRCRTCNCLVRTKTENGSSVLFGKVPPHFPLHDKPEPEEVLR